MRNFLFPILLAFLSSTLTSCVFKSLSETDLQPGGTVRGCETLDKMPFREAWYGMYFKDDKIGYSHFKIEPDGRNFIIFNDAVMRLNVRGKISETVFKQKVTVQPDLTMVAFESDVRMNGKDLRTAGKSDGKKFALDIDLEGERKNFEYPFEGKIYHSNAISLMPVVRGIKDGEKYSFDIFDTEKLGLEKIDQEMTTVKGGPGPNGAVWKVTNQYGKSVVYSWLDKKGLMVLEKAQDGALMTVLEDEPAARQFLEKKTPGKDVISEVSLIKTAVSLNNPEKLRYLKLKVTGADQSLFPNDQRQQVTVPSNYGKNEIEISIKAEDTANAKKSLATEAISDKDLASTMDIQADNKEIVSQASKITAPSDSDKSKIAKLVTWTAENIKQEMIDSFSALSVLKSREGECQSHANLYTALARAVKIPTRVVMGLVYVKKDGGFLYHAWAESYDNGWIAVDPTFNQVPCDSTHIKITSSDRSEDRTAFLRIVGKLKIEVLDYR